MVKTQYLKPRENFLDSLRPQMGRKKTFRGGLQGAVEQQTASVYVTEDQVV